MKAVRIHEFGGPDTVRVDEVLAPDPGPGEVLVRIVAAALNPVDWKIREHLFNPPGTEQLPLTLGHDFAGIVAALGPGARARLQVGDEVIGQRRGAFAEYVALPAVELVRKPLTLDFVTAASLPMPALTAWQAIIDTAEVEEGQRVLIHGASGGVGSFAAQLARGRGAFVAGSGSPSSFAWLARIGVQQLFDYHAERFPEPPRPFDVVLDPVGGAVQARSWPLLARGGLLINLVGEIGQGAVAPGGARGDGAQPARPGARPDRAQGGLTRQRAAAINGSRSRRACRAPAPSSAPPARSARRRRCARR
jgi:NADPH:quinone reductase-like Zn-dependent oxidoreductase